MAVNNFIQTVWSKKIQDDLEEKCKLVLDCTRDYEGDCQYAQTLKILAVGEPIIGNYIGQDIDIEEMSDSSQDLTVDVQKPAERQGRGRRRAWSPIGTLGAGKDSLHGIVDVAIMQSLLINHDVKELVRDYGMIIVDECHHVSAVSFEQILRGKQRQ